MPSAIYAINKGMPSSGAPSFLRAFVGVHVRG